MFFRKLQHNCIFFCESGTPGKAPAVNTKNCSKGQETLNAADFSPVFPVINSKTLPSFCIQKTALSMCVLNNKKYKYL